MHIYFCLAVYISVIHLGLMDGEATEIPCMVFLFCTTAHFPLVEDLTLPDEKQISEAFWGRGRKL
jgi:hypothetical protein